MKIEMDTQFRRGLVMDSSILGAQVGIVTSAVVEDGKSFKYGY